MPTAVRDLRRSAYGCRGCLLFLGGLSLALLWCGAAVGQPHFQRYEPTAAQQREVRLLVFPLDLVDEAQRRAVPNHLSWQTAQWVLDAISGAHPLDRDATTGQALAAGSIADFIAYNLPGTRVLADLYPYPADAPVVDGWYQYRLAQGEAQYVGTDDHGRVLDRWGELYAAFFARLGVNPRDRSTLRVNGQQYDTVYVIHGGGGGQFQPGNNLGTSGLENPVPPATRDMAGRYAWTGTATHEMTHWASGMADFYGPMWEHVDFWNILSCGNCLGAFPAPLSAWLRHARQYARVESTLTRGESARLFLTEPNRQQLAAMCVLDNSSVGEGDDLVIEYRKADPANDRVDTTGMGIPPRAGSGLLITNFDSRALGHFFSHGNEEGGLPHAFDRPAEDTAPNPYALAPVAEIKRVSGYRNDWYTLFGSGSECVGSYPADPLVLPLKSSANLDEDVVWELRGVRAQDGTFPLQEGATPNTVRPGIGFDAVFQGKRLAVEATAPDATWASAAGPIGHGSTVATQPAGCCYQQNVFTALDNRVYRDVLWVYTNRAGTAGAYWAEGSFTHEVAATGERLSGRVALGNEQGQVREGRARVVFRVQPLPLAGQAASAAVTVLEADFQPDFAGGLPMPGFSVDLTPWAGRRLRFTVRIEAPRSLGVGLAQAYFYRKAEGVVYDYVRHAAGARTLTDNLTAATAVTDPQGAVGVRHNLPLVDGFCYDTALVMRPQSTGSRGRAVFTSPVVHVPASGGILQGRCGFPALPAADRSDGALVRMTIDDGVHRLPLREWTPPLLGAHTWLAPGQAPATGGQLQMGNTADWGDGIAWGGEVNTRWTGDWVRVGDFDGDQFDDLVVFTGADRARVGVALTCHAAGAAPTAGPLRLWCQDFA